jgi:hypothetical protein
MHIDTLESNIWLIIVYIHINIYFLKHVHSIFCIAHIFILSIFLEIYMGCAYALAIISDSYRAV